MHRDYQTYVTDRRWYEIYSRYQQKYAVNPRESDKKLTRLLVSALRGIRAPRILDIGCSTGNLLRLLKAALPQADLTGGDLMAPVIDECRGNPALTGMAFDVMDVFALPKDRPFDAIIANAVCVYFEQDEYTRALTSIAQAMKPEGVYLAYEWVFPGAREQRIVENSDAHPEGLKFWFRAEDKLRIAASHAGFSELDVIPFDIPIDLPRPSPTGTDADLMTYTQLDPVTSRRLMYRGTHYQPWCHILARKG
jgi:SAM-dependent methyltransferase